MVHCSGLYTQSSVIFSGGNILVSVTLIHRRLSQSILSSLTGAPKPKSNSTSDLDFQKEAKQSIDSHVSGARSSNPLTVLATIKRND